MKFFLSPDPSDPQIHKILKPHKYASYGYLISINKFSPYQAARLLEDYRGPVILDSGGFDELNISQPKFEQWQVFYKQMEFVKILPWIPEFMLISYDWPITPDTDMAEAYYRLRSCVSNARALQYLVNQHKNRYPLKTMATIHANKKNTREMYKWIINQYNRIGLDYYSIGGLVPLSMAKNGHKQVIKRVNLVKEITRKPLHLLGVGRLEVLKHFKDDSQIASSDSSTWLRAAGKAKRIYIDGRSKSIFDRKTGKRRIVDLKCFCPACKTYKEAVLFNTEGNETARLYSGYRAVHNVHQALTYIYNLPQPDRDKIPEDPKEHERWQCIEEIVRPFLEVNFRILDVWGTLNPSDLPQDEQTQDEFDATAGNDWWFTFCMMESRLFEMSYDLCQDSSADHLVDYLQDSQPFIKDDNDLLDFMEGITEHFKEIYRKAWKEVLRKEFAKFLRPSRTPVPRFKMQDEYLQLV